MHSRSIPALGLLAAGILALAACGGTNEVAGEASSASASVPAATAPPTSPSSPSPSASPSASPTETGADPVGYLYDIDRHTHPRAMVAALVGQLAPRCTGAVVDLERAAATTAAGPAGGTTHEVYPVLEDLVDHLPTGTARLDCQGRLVQTGARLAARPSPTTHRPVAPAPTPTHRATPRAVATTHRVTPRPVVTTHHTEAAVAPGGGATALCNDGTLSYSAHHQGTCSHHHGVAVFYK
ncbi:DUF3761 domain-containing protein [Streptomyces polygonati]|uniref:DUF3761 domain-containing protein n=1 Tax=Streptomyces polygonati TaxID=1617087 RepID=A0ABV8HY39_9ACTN